MTSALDSYEDKYSQLKDYVSNLIAEQNFHSDLENKLKLAINDIDNNRIQQPQSMRLKSRNQLSLSQNNQFNVKTEELNFSNKAFNLSKKEYHHIRSNSKEKFYSLSDEEENDEEIIMNNNDNKFKLSNPINLKKILPSFKKSFYDPLYNYKKRKSLPVTCKKLNYNVWEILKGSIGKDINRFTVPTFLNEQI